VKTIKDERLTIKKEVKAKEKWGYFKTVNDEEERIYP